MKLSPQPNQDGPTLTDRASLKLPVLFAPPIILLGMVVVGRRTGPSEHQSCQLLRQLPLRAGARNDWMFR
ncbi:hypothetical protein [Curtobacterium flaccumfaciens]|uniref:hypothetical protein n=1 Tax=Curtobacterium flaccumfaciens TaxID=2035 RepID=UPI0039910F82